MLEASFTGKVNAALGFERCIQVCSGKKRGNLPPGGGKAGRGLGLKMYVAFLEQRGVSCGQRGTEEPRGGKRQRKGLEAVSQGSCVPVKEFV